MIQGVLDWLDHRTGYRHLVGEALYENIPGGARWRYVTGSALVFAFVTQVITGFFLWMYYSPSSQTAWESVYYLQHEVQGGWLLRGIHHFMAQAMVVLLALHLFQVVYDGAYKAPREMNYWIGLILMILILGLALTGYLLPWDQKGYWATNVATNLATLAPAGDLQQRLAVGGANYGHLTLTRFFALHAGVLPTLIAVFLVAHLALFRKHGITALKEEGDVDEYFWPRQVMYDAMACLIVLAIVVFRVVLPGLLNPDLPPGHWGAELGAPADSSEPFSAARPEWYFLFLFQLLKYFEGGLDDIGAIYIPSAVMLLLFLMPLWGSNVWGHRFNVAFIVLLLLGAAGLTAQALWTDNYATQVAVRPGEDDPVARARWDASRGYLDAVADAQVEAERFAALARHQGIPPTGATSLAATDPVLRGRRLFKRNCAACHDHLDEQGVGIRSGSPSAPNLYRFASREWIAGLLDKEQISGPQYFGNTKHADGEMVGYVKGDLQGHLKDHPPEEFAALIAALSAEAQRGDQVALDAAAAEKGMIEQGRAAIVKFGCTDCHKFHDDDPEAGYPDLTGYGSQEWLVDFISNPAHERFYGDNNDRMPRYAPGDDPAKHQISRSDLALIARWLRGDYERYEGHGEK
jgi:ubiquinol-cytochrome c reductase cytochrome b subunit